ncbi:PhzF family phenazine biosynthesis protein [Pigmentiphaga aceris]|uniref:PhzF family phenazine biosynthesis protein n=1 Tax=Pigmentiphaga aceris TaxID=1940612 RepID=A0A5C0AWF7_9BURK|nr:PhzF family phenazine biosynthesis protein [Pigmentiphaga aceris]QEI06648.1 PhzF family phenazine biosynthesis protein [Pigmentiphaga aceris]
MQHPPQVQWHDFRQVDVFTADALKGNPLAVVHGADGLDEAKMAAFARWTGLSETTFLLTPTNPAADYRVRIFTPTSELPFAGHPTLGTCHAWLEAGGKPRAEEVIQECKAGLIRIRRDGSRLAFAAPPQIRSDEVDADILAQVAHSLRIAPETILRARWVDNGPGWLAVMLGSRAEVLALKPDFVAMGRFKVGVVGAWNPAVDGTEASFEVRAFAPGFGVQEDPVTGSLNAGIAQWLLGTGIASGDYVASQGAALQRAGRVHVTQAGQDIWIGGNSTSCIVGRVQL